MANRKSLPWWLDGGTETCETCDQPYVLQAEYRCVACDAATCEHCIVVVDRATGEILCHACAGADGGEEGG